MFKKILISILLALFALICIIIFIYFQNIRKVAINDIVTDYYYIGHYPLDNSERVYSPTIVDVVESDGVITNVIAQYPTGVGGALMRFNFPVINNTINLSEPFPIYLVNAYTNESYPVYFGLVSGYFGILISNGDVTTTEADLENFYYKLDFNSTFGSFLALWDINISKKPIYNGDKLLQYVFVDYPNWIGNFFNIFVYFFRGLD